MVLNKLVRGTFAGTIFFTGVVGVVVLSLPCFVWVVLFSSESLHEGMWNLVFLPIGSVAWLLSTILGTWLAFQAHERPSYAWLQALFVIIVGSIFVGPLVGFFNSAGLEQLYGLFRR